MIRIAIRSILLANSAVSNLVDTRISQSPLPLKTTLPAISISKPSEQCGRVINRLKMQIDCWDLTDSGVEALKSAVEGALDGYIGIASGIAIELIRPLEAKKSYDADTKYYKVEYYFKVIYRK